MIYNSFSDYSDHFSKPLFKWFWNIIVKTGHKTSTVTTDVNKIDIGNAFTVCTSFTSNTGSIMHSAPLRLQIGWKQINWVHFSVCALVRLTKCSSSSMRRSLRSVERGYRSCVNKSVKWLVHFSGLDPIVFSLVVME